MSKKTDNEGAAKAEFVLLCDYAFTAEGGKLSIIGKFETIFVQSLPANHAEMFVVGTLKGEPFSEHVVKLHIKNSSGKELLQNSPEIKVKLSSQGGGNVLNRLFNFPIESTGEYQVYLTSGKEVLGKTNLHIIQTKLNDSEPN